MAAIAKGQKAADVTLESAEGKRVTKEACGSRDLWKDLQHAGVVVLGISGDAPASHAKFAAKYELPFTLLSDPARAVMEASKTT